MTAFFGSWLFGIAHQKCAQHWRVQKRHERVIDPFGELPEDPAGFGDDPSELLIRAEQEENFMALLKRLPLPQRDDGGNLALRNQRPEGVDSDEGDWVWRLPVK